MPLLPCELCWRRPKPFVRVKNEMYKPALPRGKSQRYTVNSRLADTSLLRTPRYYGQQQNPRRKLQTFDWNKLPLLRTLATTDLRTLYSVPTSQFYCFLSRYSGHRAASWNICTHIKSIFSAFWDCLCLFWSISASSVHQSKFLHLFLLRPSLQSRCHE